VLTRAGTPLPDSVAALATTRPGSDTIDG